ncbi:25930_t:CDS:2 [Gigaspora rosea]|nr:25930_t:CDS:2 [Gigaspora rosea]
MCDVFIVEWSRDKEFNIVKDHISNENNVIRRRTYICEHGFTNKDDNELLSKDSQDDDLTSNNKNSNANISQQSELQNPKESKAGEGHLVLSGLKYLMKTIKIKENSNDVVKNMVTMITTKKTAMFRASLQPIYIQIHDTTPVFDRLKAFGRHNKKTSPQVKIPSTALPVLQAILEDPVSSHLGTNITIEKVKKDKN